LKGNGANREKRMQMIDSISSRPLAEFGRDTETTASTTAPIRIWLVDDNRRLRMTLMEVFGRFEGIQCTASFASPNAVLSALASRVGPDVVLLDMNLGEHNGLDAIRSIKSLSRSTQVLMLTTFFDSAAETRALMSGASGFLLKSFPIERIVTAVQEAWRHPAPHLKRGQIRPESFASQSAPSQEVASPAVAIESNLQASGRGDSPRKRLVWVKQCLDLIRNFRN
jgi:DNA-binding NarL/FixJ family response regulator